VGIAGGEGRESGEAKQPSIALGVLRTVD